MLSKANAKIELFSAFHSQAVVFPFTVCLGYFEALSVFDVSPQKSEKNPPSSCGTSVPL